MKKLLTALLVMGFGISAYAADIVPVDSKGGFTYPNYSGAKTCVIGPSTGTNPVLCATGQGIILQVIPTTTTSQGIVIRDSATANLTSSTNSVITSLSVAGIFIYPRFYNGLSVNALTAGGTAEAWTIIYTQPK